MQLLITHDDFAGTNYGEWFANHLRESAALDRFRIHELCDDPNRADRILILQRGNRKYRDLRAHPLVKSHFPKCFAYDVQDWPIPYLPGLYASLPAGWFNESHHRTVGYPMPINDEIAVVSGEAEVVPDLLCTFVGGPTHPIRRRLFQGIPFGDSPDAVIRNVHGWLYRDAKDEHANVFRDYARLIRRASFSLCPRGIGTSSHRLYEVMELGRVPVILADAWVPPAGPQWERFSLRVAEKDLAELPRILAERRSEAAAMGREARQAWEEWFAPDVKFHRLAEWLAQLSAYPRSEAMTRNLIWPLLTAKARLTFTARRAKRLVMKLAGQP